MMLQLRGKKTLKNVWEETSSDEIFDNEIFAAVVTPIISSFFPQKLMTPDYVVSGVGTHFM